VTTAEDTVLPGNVFVNNGSGPDDPDGGPPPVVTAVNGSGAAVGQQITLPSGAKLTLNSDGTFSYDPNHAFDSLHLAPPGSGASNTHTTDTFQYTESPGGTATVTVTINGVDRPDTIYVGTPGGDEIIGSSPNGHLFDLTQGGTDTAQGGSGDDGFKMGATLDPNDHINGGAGNNDQVQVDGDYSAGMTLTGSMLNGIEVLAMQPGHNYKFTTADSLVAAGKTFAFWSVSMASPNFVNIDGSAEQDGSFKFYLGQGNDIAKGGNGDDLFYGGGGQDTLTGGAGTDTFAYVHVSDSTSTTFDILDFNAGKDNIHLPFAVAGINNPVSGVALDAASFDSDLANALGPDELGVNCAVLVNPSSGSYSGTTFLIVDANGTPGYQAGADYVFEIANGAGLSTANFI
jgi:VCBS repeat-containing protein